MRNRKLGKDGPEIPAIGLGCMGMAGWYGERDDDRSIATLDRTLELGVKMIDTADVYGAGENEEFVGRWLEGKRDRVFLASKCGNTFGEGGVPAGIVDGRPEYIRAACEASLGRLGVDVIDLYYLHRVDRNVPIEDSMGAFEQLRDAGKIRYIGISEASVDSIDRAAKVTSIAALQSELSLWTRDNEAHQLKKTQELGIAFVAYSPLGRGMLSGVIKAMKDLPDSDRRFAHPRFAAGNFEKNQDLVTRVAEIASDKGCTPAQLAIAWCFHRADNIIPIPGTQHPKYMEDNVAAIDIELTDQERETLDQIMPPGAAAGERYPEKVMRNVNV
jgi:aryl-alcohol dehydrogenase-like predicted oxidoreductase